MSQDKHTLKDRFICGKFVGSSLQIKILVAVRKRWEIKEKVNTVSLLQQPQGVLQDIPESGCSGPGRWVVASGRLWMNGSLGRVALITQGRVLEGDTAEEYWLPKLPVVMGCFCLEEESLGNVRERLIQCTPQAAEMHLFPVSPENRFCTFCLSLHPGRNWQENGWLNERLERLSKPLRTCLVLTISFIHCPC